MGNCLTVGELIDFLIEQPRSAAVKVCDDVLVPTKDSMSVTDALYVFSRKANRESVILLFDNEE